MNVLEKDWLMKMPLDIELKKYKLLDATQKLTLAVKLGFVYDALNEVEHQLNLLYKVKNLKNETEDRVKIMKGINLDTMSVEYEYPLESTGIEDMYAMCDYAIDELEAVYRLIRVKWRLTSKQLQITEIPVRLPTKNKGIIFLKGIDDKITVYSYSKPLSFIGDWKDMKLNKLEVNISNEKAMIKYIEATRRKNDVNRFWRCDHTITFNNIEATIIPILQHVIFNKLLLY